MDWGKEHKIYLFSIYLTLDYLVVRGVRDKGGNPPGQEVAVRETCEGGLGGRVRVVARRCDYVARGVIIGQIGQ